MLYAGIAPASLDDNAVRDSLQVLIPLLLKQQTLHWHRQEWNRIKELHAEIAHRTRKFRPQVEKTDPEPVLEVV